MQNIFLTGGTDGIGLSATKTLLAMNNRLFVTYRNEKKLVGVKSELKPYVYDNQISFLKCDLSELSEIAEIVKAVTKSDIKIDCLINNASIFENDNLQNFSEKSFTKHININLKAPAILTQNFKKILKKSEGCIINIIDQRVEKLTPFFFSYTLSKSGLVTLTKTSAIKLAPNIRVNAISPGPTLKNSRQSEKHFKKQWKSIILRKKVDLENICTGVKFLIESESITGEIINIDGGQRLAWQTPDIINTKE